MLDFNVVTSFFFLGAGVLLIGYYMNRTPGITNNRNIIAQEYIHSSNAKFSNNHREPSSFRNPTWNRFQNMGNPWE